MTGRIIHSDIFSSRRKKLKMRWFKFFGYVFLLLLAVSVGVRFDEKINQFNDTYIRGKNPAEQELIGYWLNSYKPVSTSSFDYRSLSKNANRAVDQYGTDTTIGGLPVYSAFNNRSVEWMTNDGLFFSGDPGLKNISHVNIWKYLSFPVLQKSNGGIRGAVRLDASRLIVYFTGERGHEEDSEEAAEYTIRLSIINLDEEIQESHLVLDSFSVEEHFALGGGMVLSATSDAVILSIGSASGTDDLVAGSKAQRSDSLFGKVVRVGIAKEGIGRQFLEPQVVSTGHRNPQGMYLLGNTIFAVEHGPMGGDELNIIEQNGNYGWNIRSFGAKYSGEDGSYEGARDQFTDPIFYFTPSIGISDVKNCPKVFSRLGYRPCLMVSALRDQSIHFLKLDDSGGTYTVQSVERIELPGRVRTIVPSGDSIYAFLDSKKVVRIIYAPR